MKTRILEAFGLLAVFIAILGWGIILGPEPDYEPHVDLIREVATLTADCIEKLPRSIAKQVCLDQWNKAISSEAWRP